ncbi:MAG: Rad2 nuclease [Alyxoria varia]|nr:MAG: Rad2 nuclease [Alyxoria varia]
MGVSGLLGLLKSIQKPCSLQSFRGQTIGVDAYGWLHRGAIACAIDLALGKHTTKFEFAPTILLMFVSNILLRFVDFAMHRVRMLIHFGIIPYLVFDGDLLPSKKATEQERNDRRRESKKAGLELLRLGKTAMAYQELQKAVDITPEMARMLIDELNHTGVRYVVAPYEADSQLAYLERRGFVEAVISEDSDLLVFGVRCLLTKLDQYGECIMIRQEDFSSCREVSLGGWTIAEFRRMAILSGCDYLASIPKLGLRTAHRLVRKYKDTENIIRGAQLDYKLRIPVGYLQDFSRAEATFLYQWVYDPEHQSLVNVTEPQTLNQLDGIDYIGAYVQPRIAIQVASGALNPMTKEPIVLHYPTSTDHRRNLIPRSSGAVELAGMKSKSIDSFFKPLHRQPLAELDPNSMQYSERQQQVIEEQGASRSWTPVPTPSTSASLASLQPLARPFASRSKPGPNPSKRQRLCAEASESIDSDAQVERSRFFFGASSQSNISKPRAPRNRHSKAEDFELWSDESLDDAMFQVPVENKSSSRTRGRKKISVFDERKRNKPDPLVMGGNEHNEGADASLSGNKPAIFHEVGETPLLGVVSTSSAGTDGGQDTHHHQFSMTSPSYSQKRSSQVAEPATTPLKPVGGTHVESDADAVELEDEIVQESPIPNRPPNLVRASPTNILNLRKFLAEEPPQETGKRRQLLKPKGSEDLLIPDSESDGEHCGVNHPDVEEDGRLLSPSSIDANKREDAVDEQEDKGEGERTETLNLRKFVYAAAAA